MNTRLRNSIVSLLGPKAQLRKQIEATAAAAFEELNALLADLASEYSSLLDGKVAVKAERPAHHVAMITVDADTLVFALHTNVFQFDRDHKAWNTAYVKEDESRSYSAIVNVYNFLADSFKYDRDEDMGYLIARVFINKDGSYFVEGKRQRSMGVDHFGEQKLDKNNWRRLVETAIKYTVEFDLLVPPYDTIKVTDMAHMKLAILTSKTKTAKRLGFSFNSDDI